MGLSLPHVPQTWAAILGCLGVQTPDTPTFETITQLRTFFSKIPGYAIGIQHIAVLTTSSLNSNNITIVKLRLIPCRESQAQKIL